MKWTSCPNQNTCKRCLEVEFESGEKDIACLNQKYPNHKCLLEGNFLEMPTTVGNVVVSSSECLKNGKFKKAQVILCFSLCHRMLHLEIKN